MDITNFRRINLRTVIDQMKSEKGIKADAKLCNEVEGLSATHLSQMIRGTGSFGEKVARSHEEILGLSEGYLDQPPKRITPLLLQKVYGDNWSKDAPIEFIQQIDDDKSSRNNVDLDLKKPTRLDNNIVPVAPRLLPVLSWVQAGTMTAMESVEVNDVLGWHPPLSIDDPEGCYYLKVVGISNAPKYIEGDLILVDPNVYISDLVSGDLIVVRNNTEATFKKLVIESDKRKYLEAMNPDWKPKIIEFEEGMVLVGIVIDATRPLGGSRRKRVRRT